MAKHPFSDRTEEIEMQEFGVPDWRSSGGYPIWDKLGPDQRRWEFLRRDDDYRKLWLEYMDDEEKPYCSEYSLAGRLRDPKTSWEDTPSNGLFVRNKNTGGEIVYPYFKEEPQLPQNPSEWDLALAEDAERISRAMATMPPDLYSGEIWVRFTLGSDINEQIENLRKNFRLAEDKIREFMKKLEKPSYTEDDHIPYELSDPILREPNKTQAIALLRVLDGYHSGRENPEIAKELLKEDATMNRGTVFKYLRRAKGLWRVL
jgi:hypothetical protein